APDQFETLPLVQPVYPLTQGLTSKALTKVVRQVFDTLPDLSEWAPRARLDSFGWASFRDAMRAVHIPQTPLDGDLAGPARMRLAYDEYLAGQLALLLVRSTLVAPRGIARTRTGQIVARVVAALPFALTAGQRQAIADIHADLTAPERMSRLLQGDVGAGKTVVALMAMAAVAQSALMAPTELLAAQHFRTLKPLASAAGLYIVLLTGKQPAGERRAALEAI